MWFYISLSIFSWKCIFATYDSSNICQSLSFSVLYDTKRGIRLNIKYFGNDTDDAIVHVHQHIFECSKNNKNSKKDMYPCIFFPPTLNEEKIRCVLDKEYEEILGQEGHMSGHYLFEHSLNDDQNSKLWDI